MLSELVTPEDLHEVVPKRYKSRFTHKDMKGTWPKDQDTVLQNSSIRKVTWADDRTQEKVIRTDDRTQEKVTHKVNSLSWAEFGTTSHAKQYQSIKFRGACCTWLESSSSLLSHPTNGSSFGFPDKELWSD